MDGMKRPTGQLWHDGQPTQQRRIFMIRRLMLALTAGLAIGAHAASNPVKEYSGPVQKEAAAMQACGEAHGQPYARIPQVLNEKYFHLLKLSGKKVRQSAHQEQIKARLAEEHKSAPTQADCKTRLMALKGLASKMDSEIESLEKPATPKP